MMPTPSSVDHSFFDGFSASNPWAVMLILSTHKGYFPTKDNSHALFRRQGPVFGHMDIEMPVKIDITSPLPDGPALGPTGWETAVDREIEAKVKRKTYTSYTRDWDDDEEKPEYTIANPPSPMYAGKTVRQMLDDGWRWDKKNQRWSFSGKPNHLPPKKDLAVMGSVAKAGPNILTWEEEQALEHMDDDGRARFASGVSID